MYIHEDIPSIPEWNDINLIIKDLRTVLDAIQDVQDDNAKFRPAIARTIAMIREEKIHEMQVSRARGLAQQLKKFKIKSGGVVQNCIVVETSLARITALLA